MLVYSTNNARMNILRTMGWVVYSEVAHVESSRTLVSISMEKVPGVQITYKNHFRYGTLMQNYNTTSSWNIDYSSIVALLLKIALDLQT